MSESYRLIETRLKQLLNIEDPLLQRAAQYAVLAPAKRLRPQLVIAIGGTQALDAACAIELIHTYSLIHDDLPSMDDDDERRGQPSLHIREGEAVAILTGDFLLTYAFELLASYPRVLKDVAKKLGASGIVGGQIKDLEAKCHPLTFDAYCTMAKQKTGALFAAACITGALIGDHSEEEIALYERFGEVFGIWFQIKDDLEDGEQFSSILTIITKKEAQGFLQNLHAQLFMMIEKLSNPPEFIKTLVTKTTLCLS